MNVESNSLGQYIWRSFLGLYERFWEMYIKVPPVEDLSGLCSMLKPGRLFVGAFWNFYFLKYI